MSEQIKTTYKGVEITYNEACDVWSCEHSPRGYAHESLAKVKERIDAWMKAERSFERFTALRITLSSLLKQKFGNVVTVTSRTDEGDLWVTDDEVRSKIDKNYIDDNIVADTPENRARINIVNNKRADIAILERQIAEELAAMERIKFGGEE